MHSDILWLNLAISLLFCQKISPIESMKKPMSFFLKKFYFAQWLSVLVVCLFLNQTANAQSRPRALKAPPPGSNWTYDIGASTGSYNGNNYSELHLALNWILSDFWTWRNSAFSRFGSNMTSAFGLDSSARLTLSSVGDSGFGVNFFAGPGYRFSNNENSAAFAEAGLTLKLAGISVGVGYKGLYYTNPGQNSDGTNRPKGDSNIFLILAGGGAF